MVFSTTADFRVPAYVLIPKNLKGPAPAIVDLHSHGGMFLFGKEKVIDLGQGRNHPAMIEYQARNYDGRPTATALVRRGYVVISIDAFMFGERRTIIDADLGLRVGPGSKYTIEDVRRINATVPRQGGDLVKALTYAGLTWPGIVSGTTSARWTTSSPAPRSIPSGSAACGISMGGYRSLYLAGLDDRIRAGCVVGFMSTVRPMIRRHLDTHSFVHFVPELHRDLDFPDVVALRAPKPLMVQQCRQDGLFPVEGMEESLRKIGEIYAKAGAKERFSGRFYDVPHRFDVPMQEDAFAFFDRHLKG